ncbi:hypothetical protein C8R43DRAFT_942603 [Mycena crocata]|nr:hypothetical protein C8R43DRAFT_942603 [Mycena crocata]
MSQHRAPAPTPRARAPVTTSSSRGQPTQSRAQLEEKENERRHRSVEKSKSQARSRSTANQNNGAGARAHQDQDESDDEDDGGPIDGFVEDKDDEDGPVQGRARRISEKKLQLIEQAEEADARKAANALKVKKRQLKAAGQDVDEVLEPRRDDTFTSRTVHSRPVATKILAQRNNKVPPAPTFSSSSSQRTSTGNESSSCSPSPRAARDSPASLAEPNTLPGTKPRAIPTFSLPCPGLVPRRVHLELNHRPNDDESDDEHDRRGSSPVAGEKRAHSPVDNMRPVQAQKTSSSGGRPKAKDYDDVTQEVLALVIILYRCYLSTRHGFPDHVTELEFVRLVWALACKILNIVMDLPPAICKLITNRGSHLRGELKTKIKPLVEVTYGFKSGHNKKAIAHNRSTHDALKTDLTFAFKDVISRKGIFKNSIIQMAVNAMWFANRRDEGPSYPDMFNPFPKQALALVLTARTKPHNILDNILLRLHNVGRFHSGAQPITQSVAPALSRAAIDAAIKEYEENSETESDGEYGDHED